MPKIADLTFFILLVALCGCGTNPASLSSPTKITCVALPNPLEYTSRHGISNYVLHNKLSPGLYISEKIDGEGTYFRGAAGAVTVWPENATVKTIYDGGFFVPNNPSELPRIYYYITLEPLASAPFTGKPDCTQLLYVKNPDNKKISLVAASTAGAMGGVAGRAAVPGSRVSYGQAAIGGSIGIGIVAAIINSEIGNIQLVPLPESPSFSSALRERVSQNLPLEEGSFGK